MTSAQIHSRNMKRLRDIQEGFVVTRMATKRTYKKQSKLLKRLKSLPYVFLASVVTFAVVAKVYYDIGSEMTAYAINGPISPVPKPTPPITIQTVTITTREENQDTWIRESSMKFATTEKPESYLKYQLHCLANKESGHHATNKCGDNGVSCGMYQWREPSWEIIRGQMLEEKLITEIGSLWNDKQAIETTAYALTHGYENWWGPIVNKNQCK